ncbi:DUF6801 domain-containing protein [Streptomyces sp. CA2R106]|uniref:DUF6801 domain-containing protein n=1 Tax=Streptomyces sp. CA2R106 TaxID=3120153 RepID=UPI003008D5D1
MDSSYGAGSPRRRIGLAAGAALTAAGAAVAGPGAGSAAAAPVAATLHYTCTFPYIGGQQITARISADFPSSVAAGTSSPRFAVHAAADVDGAFTAGLRQVLGVRVIEGSVDARTSVAAPQGTRTVSVHLAITPTTVPASGTFAIPATGTAPALGFTAPGHGTVSAGDFTLHLVPEDASGDLVAVGKVDVPCALNAGQSGAVAAFRVTPSATKTTPPAAPGSPSAPGTGGHGSSASAHPGTSVPATATRTPSTSPSTGASTAAASGTPSATASGAAPGTSGPGQRPDTATDVAAADTAKTGSSSGHLAALIAGILAAAALAAAAALRLVPRLRNRRTGGSA